MNIRKLDKKILIFGSRNFTSYLKLIYMSFRFGFKFLNYLKPCFRKLSLYTIFFSYLMLSKNNNNSLYCKCIDIQKLDKMQYVKLLSSSPKEILIIVYKHHFQTSDNGKQLPKKILAIKSEIQSKNIGIDRIVLVDDLDVKHIQIFQKWIRDQKIGNSTESFKEKYGAQPYNIYYINSHLLSSNPIKITKLQNLQRQVKQIRQIFTQDPSQQAIIESLRTPMLNTVIKSCITPKCQENFKLHLTEIIQYGLFDNKKDFKFYLVKDNSFLSALLKKENLALIKQKQDIYLMRKDILGENLFQFSDFSNDMQSTLTLLQFIKPRIHVISKNNPEVDFSWFVTTGSHRKPTVSFTPHQPYSYFRDYQILKALHSKYGHAVELMLVNSQKLCQILRHTTRYSPEWVIFNLSSQYQYPKKFLSTSSQDLSSQQRYLRLSQGIKQYIKKPQVYDQIKIGSNQINVKQLLNLKQKYAENNAKKFGLFVSMNNCKDFTKTKITDYKQKDQTPQQEQLMDVYCIDGKQQNTGFSGGFLKYEFV